MENNKCSCGASPCKNCEECQDKKGEQQAEENTGKFATKIFYNNSELLNFVTNQTKDLKNTRERA
ncbi:MAG: hypothetical protein PHX09_00830 [Clostridia bacterium]|nr:hypothetical protein [Clostridia bacterium]MDD4686188.1 hypothetical protein [Clostridia bacterium]